MTDITKLKSLFKDKDVFALALTHKSWVNEHPGGGGTNERLEFLGDAILEFVVSRELYQKFPEKEEGYLTALRANLVNTDNLANVAKRLGVGESLFLSKGEEEGGGRENPSLLADTVEAIIGALYLDRGLDVVSEFIGQNIIVEIPEKVSGPLKDAKSRLQEYVQGQGLPAPRYKVIEEAGPDHNKEFVIEVAIDGKSWGKGLGKSKAVAEQEAAQKALSMVQSRDIKKE
ncbi:MAG: Ribonuclease 3 [Candidatus Woesebacteria bacterium GW2011_GWD1_47_21]|uniref:Ribonuclease 3 n=5 Tax=Candidatus Woeseibacteriota TaxID=1752722 RepID=A0A0G1T582_9BACT|nr:MAG: Ribonuclease 3 [Candidatus Woesebacteria bacterium GW2011_GWE1_45_18]KKU49338.1 MAG: Ribonuclease 3 [Candidatus Woesebacteria bacterium GW2011_GWF2_46_8]KKU71187.1 MAG: Ribonuclease 3 [Candidatus Woesebacteria bacterium GW2011_GWD1_47_21]OGM85396.1 MAG: ribonuclease III [Candidatus Woesebacteria bacterium RIFOXYC1_FULL_46_16]OGM89993.1 MAG: ribonuclease III [Candidatus Woesebacteria bacterium RIFOXYD1_FULL_46_19]